MPAETMMLYKLIVLYMLSKVDYPLSNPQLSNFMLEKEYTGYFNVQQAISDLIDDGYVNMEVRRNYSLFSITETGRETLALCLNNISKSIRNDIDEYLRVHDYQLREEVSYPTDYERTKTGEYLTRMQVLEHGNIVIELRVAVTSEDEAEHVCSKWKKNSADIYSAIVGKLMN